jgi:low temperature requirement protein LtrA
MLFIGRGSQAGQNITGPEFHKIPQGFFDMFTVVMLTGYLRRPLHLFGSIGLLFFNFGFVICGGLTVLKIITGTIQEHNTMLLLGIMLLVFGFQWISTGLLGEIIAGLDEEIETKNAVKRKSVKRI